MKNEKKDNVIDMTARIVEPDAKARVKGLKVRFDLEQAKVAVSASLLSIVVLVTLANNNLMASGSDQKDLASNANGSRAIASVRETESTPVDNTKLIEELAKRDLSAQGTAGRAPSLVEKLAFETLEGRYAVRLENGKLREIEYSDARNGAPDQAKKIENLASFIDSQKALLPAFDRTMKLSSEQGVSENLQTFQLVNGVSMPVAKVQFRLDDGGRLLAMHVTQLAAK